MSDLWPLVWVMAVLTILAALACLFFVALRKHLRNDCRTWGGDGVADDLTPREQQIKDQLVSWSKPMELG